MNSLWKNLERISLGEESHDGGAGAGKNKVLLIDDDESFAQILAFALSRLGSFEVFATGDPQEAANEIARQSYDLVITDWRLPPFTGFSVLEGLRSHSIFGSRKGARKLTPVIVITASDAIELGAERGIGNRFQFLGVVSKEQPMQGILEQINLLYGNFPVSATG